MAETGECCGDSSGQICVNFSDLPHEIIERILVSDTIEHEDVARVACACKKFRDAAYNNKVWRSLICKRWPNLIHRYSRTKQYSWREEYAARHSCSVVVRKKLAKMSPTYYQREELSNEDFAEFAAILMQHEYASMFVIDELMSVIYDGDRHRKLTEKYYAEKVLRYIQQIRLREEWKKFLQEPEEKQNLEEGAILLAQWFQPSCDITENGIRDQLGDIAHLVKTELEKTCPQHPLCTSTEEMLPAVMTSSLWKAEDSRKILLTLNYVLFEHLKFSGNDEDYYDDNNSYINQVLERKTGIPISLCVLYASVARRLGVVCQPVNFPSHFLLTWLEHPSLADDMQYTYIDVFNQGRLLNQQECRENVLPGVSQYGDSGSLFTSSHNVTTRQVIIRMIRNLIYIGQQQGQREHSNTLTLLRCGLELFVEVSPEDMEMKLMLVRVYDHLGINLAEAMDYLQTINATGMGPIGIIGHLMQSAESQMEKNKGKLDKKITPKISSKCPEVEFTAGMIMKHNRYHYTCVIYGWDKQCLASDQWIQQMGVHNLPNKQFQPFYNVLVEDGSIRYAAQESLEMAEELKVVTHPDVGKYFREYTGTHYSMNNEKLAEYPEDFELTQKTAAAKYTNNNEENGES